MATRADSRMPERERIDLHIHLPTRTVVKVLLTLIAAWAGLRLWPEFVLLLVSLLVAVALHPVGDAARAARARAGDHRRRDDAGHVRASRPC